MSDVITYEKNVYDRLYKFEKRILRTLNNKTEIYTSWDNPRGGESPLEREFEFTKKSQVFNRRLQFKPFVIVYCRNTADVVATFKAAKDNGLPFKIRAGGHDHEGECIGTNVILIDVSKMDTVEIDRETMTARIGPGNKFQRLTSLLADKDVMIPHGTCATVGIAGFTMGGGWGPWTRKEGMACERLIGATIILGDGTVTNVDVAPNGKVPELLWALRGGGGMSYGIVTELRFSVFELPPVLHRFQVEWNGYENEKIGTLNKKVPTLQILQQWEALIKSSKTPNLIGTNLKINAIPIQGNEGKVTGELFHNCLMYGYWEGKLDTLKTFLETSFSIKITLEHSIRIDPETGKETKYIKGIVKDSTGKLTPCCIDIETGVGRDFKDKKYGEHLMSSWDRESHTKILQKLGINILKGTPLQPDYDKPSPHKITSRLVNKEGLGTQGYTELLNSLTSPLIFAENRKLGLFSYVTLGAIVGDYYKKNPDGAESAFPYKDKLYTIQYQTWWNEEYDQKEEGQDNYVYDFTNRALDWIEISRSNKIANTSGAFISFKDNSIPTKTYFSTSYERLKLIKERYVQDDYNHFRSRKTII